MSERSLLGVWRLVSLTHGRDAVHTGQSHLVVHAELLFEVWPDIVYYDDRPGPESRYTLTWTGADGQLVVHNPDRPASHMSVRFVGDALHMRVSPVLGEPNAFTDTRGLLAVYERERDASAIELVQSPPVRLPKPRRSHPRLGELTRDEGLEWWETTICYGGVDVAFHYAGPVEAEDDELDRAADVVEAAPCDSLRAFAAEKLLTLHNQTWRRDGPRLDSTSFAARIRPESFGVNEDGSAAVYFHDGDLFLGHSIIVSLDSDRAPIDAEIAR